MITVEGLFGIKATVLADSISEAGIRMLTFEIEYPRIVHSELLTHGMLAPNSASSRAIPFEKMKEQLRARPVRFGEKNSGMQDKGQDYKAFVLGRSMEYEGNDGDPAYSPEEAWEKAKEDALFWSEAFYKAGYHKQCYNRITEAYQMMKTVISGTEWPNFFWLRDHGAADPTLAELARVMRETKDASVPMLLYPGDWHLPYLDRYMADNGTLFYFDTDEKGERTYYQYEDAVKISSARTAAVSFRNVEYGIEKSKEVFDRLIGDDRIHGSATEHQATPIANEQESSFEGSAVNIPESFLTWQPGVTHVDRQGQLWSAKLRGWIQFRKLIPGENHVEY